MATRSRFVFLMHPKEFKQEKAATGRLTHLCLSNSEIVVGVGFDEDDRVQELIRDPQKLPVLLYPGAGALNLSAGGSEPALTGLKGRLATRELVVFVLDATWALARKMLKLSPMLQRLPRVMFTPSAPSRYVIKQQPAAGCLSTLEAVHELLGALDRTGIDRYAAPELLLETFDRMQRFQIACATDPARGGYRRSGYRAPGERKAFHGRSARRRARLFQFPAA